MKNSGMKNSGMKNSGMKTRAQTWSRMAYQRVVPGSDFGNEDRDEAKYKTSCNKMPGLIHQSGLLQALVFQCARDPTGQIYVDHLAQTCLQDDKAGHMDLIGKAQDAALTSYLALSRDVAQVAQWFRRFAQIELHAEDDDD